jgi:hypothetical protein
LIPVALVLGTVLVYANTLLNGFVWDDFPVLVDNPAVRGLGNLPAFFTDYRTGVAAEGMAYYRPLRTMVFALIYAVFGLNAAAYHALNVIVHAGNVLLVYGVFSMLSDRRSVAAIVAAVFAVHPIMTEAVTNITGLADLLSASFVLLALRSHLRQRARGAWRPGSVAAVYGLFTLALLAKEMALTLPLLVLVSDLLGRTREHTRSLDRSYAGYMLGFAVIAGSFVALRSTLLGGLAAGEWTGVTFARTMLMQATVLVDYLRLLVFPVGQSVRHEVAIPESYLHPEALSALFVIGMVAATAAWCARRNPHVTFGILWFVAALLPVMNIVPLRGSMIGERFLYIPMLGLTCAAVAGLTTVAVSRHGSTIAMLTVTALLTFFSVLTVRRNAQWRDNVTIFEAGVAVSPRSNALRFALIREYERLGLPEQAEAHRRAGARNTEMYVMQYLRLAERAARAGNEREALTWYRRVLRLDPRNQTASAAVASLEAKHLK